ncbi:ATP-dependent nuclease subunit B [Granulibacter bethesdensis]|uniref:ATP-dependent nuclease subunit B n=2 Tax=Granulibacter bethesdensis TaxID=364410 RepID=A0AAC9P9H9_9PROT|nr:ATP-dependent nuclease subunit B [Granulibacter bethesdensis]APH62912.1 ATP-dependent nuclease subunit B [Granulibacter bethesdensis]
MVPPVHAGGSGGRGTETLRGGNRRNTIELAMHITSIPPDWPFLDTVAAAWLGEGEARPLDTADGIILLPTRRAARALADAFLRLSGGRPLLLPRITALGALDETPLALHGALDLPPAVDTPRRLAELTRLILALPDPALSADSAWMLARELAKLMDEAARAGIDLATALPDAVDPSFAAHWQTTLTFLQIVTRAWPDWLAEEGLTDPAARQAALLRRQATHWQDHPPATRIWAAGISGAAPAEAMLLKTIARLKQGLVILPGLDMTMPEEAWAMLEASHPQAGMRDLLTMMDARRDDVAPWGLTPPPPRSDDRSRLLHQALLPAEALTLWREAALPPLNSMFRLEPEDEQQEAVAIALILRDVLETPGYRAALITPDRGLAVRVSTELARFGVIADDSAGEPLAETPPAVFLRLLAEAVRSSFSPVALLSLLKHPMTGLGMDRLMTLHAARGLEQHALRGPRPPPGLSGLRAVLEAGETEAAALLDRLEQALLPLIDLVAQEKVAPHDYLRTLLTAGEALAASDTRSGAERLWAREEGEALAVLLAETLPALPVLPPQPPDTLPGLFDAMLEGIAVRSRRAIRRFGEDDAEHPRLFIWGLLEAQLQHVDVAVLGGLSEGVWPPATDPGPWMSRPMRRRAGLPSAEQTIGQAAHDFVQAACSASVAILSCPARREGAPVVAARWLARIDALLKGYGQRLPIHPATAWARMLDQPERPSPVRPPRPCPPRRSRPRSLSVTEIGRWLTDPYRLYAERILKLKPLDPLEQDTDAADFGMIVHDGMQCFLEEAARQWPGDPLTALRTAFRVALDRHNPRPALRSWWLPRLNRIAAWVATQEQRDTKIHTETSGIWHLSDFPGGPFRLKGRADRIEIRRDGSLRLLDYKTGTVPSAPAILSGEAPQLPLEAAMMKAGAFPDVPAQYPSELVYWRLSGGRVAGEEVILGRKTPAAWAEEQAQLAAEKLRDLVTRYDDPDFPYLAQPFAPGHAPMDAYAHLARVPEWADGDEA